MVPKEPPVTIATQSLRVSEDDDTSMLVSYCLTSEQIASGIADRQQKVR